MSGQRIKTRLVSRWGLAAALSAAVLLSIEGTRAQPVTDQFISSAEVTTAKNCAFLRVNFNVRIRYTGHFPQDKGSQLRISLQTIDGDAGVDGRLTPREGVRLINGAAASIASVQLALDESIGPVLLVQFLRPVSFQVIQSGSFESVVVAIANSGSAAACAGAAPAPNNGVDRPTRGKGKLSEADTKLVEASMDEGRAAIRKGQYPQAIELLKKVLNYPENPASAEAQEMIGVARLKSGQRAEARADFEDYLRRYGSGEGAERVRQRLAALLTAAGEGPERLRGSLEAGPDGKPLKKAGSAIDGTRWSVSGSLSTLYITNDSTSTVKDISVAPNPNADPDAHRSHFNTLLSNFDLFGTAENDQIKSKFKLAITNERQLDTNIDKFGVSTAQVDYTLKEYDVTTRIGRQSRNTGGVIGRFDGAVVSWQQSPDLRWNVLAGSPNWSRFDAPFAFNKTMYGTSLDFGKWFGVLETSIFFIEQFDHDLIDRQAIGAEFRYFDKNKSALGTIDYDVHFRELNAAIFSGTYTLEDQSVLNTALDYRKVPYLSSWNALQGQPFLTLYDMMKFNTKDEIRQLALDRTPTFESAMVSYSRPLNPNWQIGGDATVTYLTGTLPSGGVDGTPASGLEYYVSAQVTGTGIFKPGDLFMGALRYASLSDSKVYVLDVNTRYPITPDLSVSPRLRLGYRRGSGTDLKEVTILPSVLVNYLIQKDLGFEAELGTKFMDTSLAGVKTKTQDLFATVGLRKDFNYDGLSQCRGMIVSCSWARPGVLQAAAQGRGAAQGTGDRGTGVMQRPSSPAILPVFFEAGLRYWFSSGRTKYDYYADTTPTDLVSRLSYSGLTAHSGEAFFRLDMLDGPLTNAFVKGYIGGGAIKSGKLFDEDFPPFIDPYSQTQSDAGGQLRYASIDVGYNLFEIERFRLGGFVGYHHWLETVDARGCAQIGGNPFICAPTLDPTLKVITEEDKWKTFRAGATASAKLLDRLTWHVEAAYTWTSQQALDTHYFTFGPDPASGHGTGFQAETILNYQLTDHFNLGVGGRWWHFNTTAVDSFNQLLKYTTDRYGVFVQGSYKLNAGLDGRPAW